MPSERNYLFLSCMYKMIQISKEGYKNCEVKTIDKVQKKNTDKN